MKIKTTAVAIIIFVMIFGGIALASALGLWNTQRGSEPARYGNREVTQLKGEYNPADIRGSYSFGEISSLFKVPIEDLLKAFAVEEDQKDFKCKDLEKIYSKSAEEGKEVGTDSVRIFVGLYKGLPISLNEAAYLPESAVNILKSKGNLNEEKLKYIESHMFVK
ncbi:hypothetical protein KYB31_08450 [Clostridium felsineum]|uniref:hypothetical protein n=1 Tax=Clostridium felsineum TaxID=36839 RepID=UPI00214D6BC1|nr:hypothetical protein [Clostridium felsineum]MCR3759018.1 hypothetical protein [Clostridium felsineum]